MNTVEMFTDTEVLMEGESVTIVETHRYAEVEVIKASIWAKPETSEFTPMFAPLFAPDYTETRVIEAPVFEAAFVAPALHDLAGNLTWLC